MAASPARTRIGQAEMNFEICRRNMVENQLRPNRVTNEGVLAAMGTVPREKFAAGSLRGVAYVDEDIPLGNGRFLIEPMVLGRLLQAAEIGSDDVVLDIGCGTGYTAAVCARIAATVVALESDRALAEQAGRTLAELGADNVVVVEGPLARGYADQAPYDVILIDGAVQEIPDIILGQLGEGGRLTAVVDAPGQAPHAVLALNCGGVVSRRKIFDASIPPLPGFERAPGFVF
jgi:protein-L-isoaspartate(D-aspartate) O-methyltransferase